MSGPAPSPIAVLLMIALGIVVGEIVWRASERRHRQRG